MSGEHVILILGMAAITYATRVGFIGVARQTQLHPMLLRALKYVPASILAALVFPAVLAPTGEFEDPLGNIYILGSIITLSVLFTTKRQWLAIVLGVASLVLMRQFMPA